MNFSFSKNWVRQKVHIWASAGYGTLFQKVSHYKTGFAKLAQKKNFFCSVVGFCSELDFWNQDRICQFRDFFEKSRSRLRSRIFWTYTLMTVLTFLTRIFETEVGNLDSPWHALCHFRKVVWKIWNSKKYGLTKSTSFRNFEPKHARYSHTTTRNNSRSKF